MGVLAVYKGSIIENVLFKKKIIVTSEYFSKFVLSISQRSMHR